MLAIFRPSAVALGVAVVALGGAQIGAQAPSCEPVGNIRFVCGQDGPEDLVAVPGTPWLVASAYGTTGGLFAINTKEASSTRLFPSATATERLDRQNYDSCPGPLRGEDREHFRTHGLYLKEGRRGVHTLYAVHHGGRESVEMFELDTRKVPFGVTWTGCVVAPDPIGLTSSTPRHRSDPRRRTTRAPVARGSTVVPSRTSTPRSRAASSRKASSRRRCVIRITGARARRTTASP